MLLDLTRFFQMMNPSEKILGSLELITRSEAAWIPDTATEKTSRPNRKPCNRCSVFASHFHLCNGTIFLERRDIVAWLERMNKVLDHIEANLDREIDMGTLAKIACYSMVNLQRVFSIIADMPLSEYIRRRRLTLAAFDLQNSNIKVLDLALKYGYDSPESFARAFNAVHGTTPSSARSDGVMLKAYPRISFLLTLKGAVPMDYKIEKKSAFSVYGIEGVFTTENGENLKTIPRFWDELCSDGRYAKLMQSTGVPGNSQDDLCLINAICDYETVGGNKFPYMIFAFMTEKSDTSEYKVIDVPAATWAIFKSERHKIEQTSATIQKLISRVYTDWLPTAQYEKVDGFELELYYGNGDECWCETWIRIDSK